MPKAKDNYNKKDFFHDYKIKKKDKLEPLIL